MTLTFRWFFAGALALFLSVSAALAQEPLDYESWEKLAGRAERVLLADRASDSSMESLRSEVVVWRDQFLAARDGNAARLNTLQSQLDALGPAPEEGQEEAVDLTARRAELTDQIATLTAPVKQAEEAYSRADGIISEIDTTIRSRQADALMRLGPSPLNPAHWAAAVDDLRDSIRRSWTELVDNIKSDLVRADVKENAPVIVLFAVVGILLLGRGQHWARRASERIDINTRRGAAVWRFVVSLGQIILPWLGILSLVVAIVGGGLLGPRWTLFVEQVPFWAMLLLGIHWLAEQSFHPDDRIATLPLDQDDRRQARRLADILAFLYVARDMLDTLTQFDRYPQESLSVIQFPLLLLSAYFLVRLGRVRNDAVAIAGDTSTPDVGLFRMRMARVLGRAAIIMGTVGPILAAIGYTRVGEALIYPAIATLAVTGLVLVLQRFVNDLYALATRSDDKDSLLPVLGGFVLVMAAAPILALIWGVREAELFELWTKFLEGFQLGETRISPSDFLVVVVVFTIGYMMTRLFQGALRSSVLPKTTLDKGGQTAIVSGVGYIGIFVSAVIAITIGGLDLSSLAIVAGALSVGIGFGLQNIVSNFVSGIILLIERPISEGDWIEVGGTHGTVKEISVRSTRIVTFDRYEMIVPNADIVSGTVSNYTRGNSLGRIIVPVGVAYGTDTRRVEKILLNIARDHPLVLMNPAPYVVFRGFGADSMDFEIRAILTDINNGLGVRTEMNHLIAERFAEENIEIPFAQRDVWLRNPEALRGEAAEAAPQIVVADGTPAAASEEESKA